MFENSLHHHARTLTIITMMLLLILSGAATAQLEIKGENVNFRVGIQGQLWADWTQADIAGAQGYAQNIFLRRARLIAGGDIGRDLSFFVETDSPNLGKTPKLPSNGFLLQDAFLEWKASSVFRIDGGLFLVPLSRNTLQSTVSYYTLDISPLATINNSSTQSVGLRDLGFGARGFFLRDKVQYRFGVFQGERDPNARNSLRTSGYLQYDFFDTETGYTFTGTALGKKKILAIDAGYDAQGAYRAESANLAFDKPVFGGDEIGGQFQFFHYDGASKFINIREQNDWFLEAAYYLHRAKLQPFARYEEQNFVATLDRSKDLHRIGGGFNYYIHGQNLKWTMQVVRALPQNRSTLKPTNEATVQLQVFYF